MPASGKSYGPERERVGGVIHVKDDVATPQPTTLFAPCHPPVLFLRFSDAPRPACSVCSDRHRRPSSTPAIITTMKRIRVRFVGRVQGVGFRATCRAIASSRPVTGWVRNEPDGSVLLEVQGDATAVEGFLQAIHDRLTRNIQHADRADVTPRDDDLRFEITH